MGVPAVYIDPQLCMGCELCEETCPVEAIEVDPFGVGGIVSFACIGCLTCLQECPLGAIKLYD